MQSECEVLQRKSFSRGYDNRLTLSGQKVEEVVCEAHALYWHLYEYIACQSVGLQCHFYFVAPSLYTCLYACLGQLLFFRISEIIYIVGQRRSVLSLQC